MSYHPHRADKGTANFWITKEKIDFNKTLLLF